MIIRQEYLQQLKLLKDQKVIKVITGIRRSGKSTLLELFRAELKNQGVKKSQIQSFNFEEETNVEFRNWRTLHQAIEKKLVSTEMNYVFLDEIQKVEQFEEVVDSLFVKKNVDLYITGSNAFLLSGELATLLTGRYVSIHVLPFSFKEYSGLSTKLTENEKFGEYLNNSSFPEAVNLSKTSPTLATKYLQDVYETIIKKDIYTRYEIRDKINFERVLKFVLDSVGSFVSARSIADNLNVATKRNESQIYHQTVNTYLSYLTEVYLLYKIDRYDVRGKNILKTQDKYYVVDLGFRNLLLGDKPRSDLGHKLENIVFLELKRRDHLAIYVGKQNENEVDFVVEKGGGVKEYYQVAWSTVEQKTLERELLSLQKIKDNHPKYIITTDPEDTTYEGIKKINVVGWLLSQDGGDN